MRRFDAARRAALMEDLLRLVARRPVDLLPFEEVRQGLRLRHMVDRGTYEVPLEAIVGTIDRGREFNRMFLPRAESLRHRWERVNELAEGSAGFAPVELYQVGHAYFVVDGHHRVSVARALNLRVIEAHVKEFVTPVPLDPQESLEEVMLKRTLADFLEVTGLSPEGDEFRATVAHGYDRLLDHINVHRYFLALERGTEVTWEDGVAAWRDHLYRPMVELIQRAGVMDGFPGRTATDLYLFTMDHLHFLRSRYRVVRPELGVRHFRTLARRHGTPPGRGSTRRRGARGGAG
jgi:hypothetical protein